MKPNVQNLSLAIFLGLAVGAGAFAGLAAFAQPENFRDRVANLDDRLEQIAQLSRGAPALRNYRPGALCPAASAEHLSALSNDLQARAGNLGLGVVALSIDPAPSAATGVDRVAVQLEVSGPYPAATSFLASLAAQSPKIFVDRVDLSDKTTKVALKFAGHFYCSTAT